MLLEQSFLFCVVIQKLKSLDSPFQTLGDSWLVRARLHKLYFALSCFKLYASHVHLTRVLRRCLGAILRLTPTPTPQFGLISTSATDAPRPSHASPVSSPSLHWPHFNLSSSFSRLKLTISHPPSISVFLSFLLSHNHSSPNVGLRLTFS